jgi:tetratricopeptide (TPR) repeat protein
MSTFVRGIAAVICLVTCFTVPRTASAQDAVLAGYQQFHAGDTDGAQQYFARLVASRPADLSARLGELVVLEERARTDASLEREFERKIDAFLADTERRYSRSSADDDALFHLSAGYLLRAQYRVTRDKGMFGAARDGAKMKRFAETYLARHPEHGDAYLAPGLYNYFVDLAPAFVRVIRTFLFLPSGNRAEGLKQIERAYRDGSYFSFVAGLALTEIYGTFEARPGDGIGIGERLARQYPDNPTPHLALASLYMSPAVENYAAAADRYQAVIDQEDRRRETRVAGYQARFGLANARFRQWRLEDAIGVLPPAIDADPAKFRSIAPNALLQRANFRALLHDPRAVDDARRVRSDPRWKDWHDSADELISWIEKRRASGESAVYAALVPANLLAAERKWDEAAASYERLRQQYPNDVQVRFRLGYLALLRGDLDRAIADLTPATTHRASPTWLQAQALLHIGRAHDLGGRRPDAIRFYERIVDDFEDENAAFAARVGLLSPYRRRQGLSTDGKSD